MNAKLPKSKSAAAAVVVLLILICGTCAFLVGAGAPQIRADQQVWAPKEFMSLKRLYSQLVLEGLMLERSEAVVMYGDMLRDMTEAKLWQQFSTAEYSQHSRAFQKNVQEMVTAASQKDLDSAMDAYLKSLQSCYACHKYVRHQQRSKSLSKESGSSPSPGNQK